VEDIILLDTVMLFDFLADREDAERTEEILTRGKGAVSAITVYELFRGVESQKHIEQRSTLLTSLHVLELSSKIARLAGKIFTDLRGKGMTVSNEDILIAATCIHHNLVLFTANRKHFEIIEGLRLYS
jgi:tRNA(fMet)-specific endonuclease VapC